MKSERALAAGDFFFSFQTGNTGLIVNALKEGKIAPMRAFFFVFVRRGTRPPPGQNGGWRCPYAPYNRSETQN
ncbi:hypothetical protein, partial [Enterobacter hormaechei]